MGKSSGKARVGLKSGAGAEQAVAPQVTQLYVPASRNAWRFRRMGRIGPLRSTLDGKCSAGSRPVVSDLGRRGKAPRAQVASPTPPLAAPVVPPASQSAAPSLEGTGGLTGRSLLAVGLESPPLSVSEERQLAILTQLPFVVPFEERVKVCSWFFAD